MVKGYDVALIQHKDIENTKYPKTDDSGCVQNNHKNKLEWHPSSTGKLLNKKGFN